jgi:hypothetical protein
MRESSQTQLNQIDVVFLNYIKTTCKEISLPAHPHAAYISLTLKYFEENLMMATSGRNM